MELIGYLVTDKFKTCKDCRERRADPNCHSTCEGYLHRKEELDRRRERNNFESALTTTLIEGTRRVDRARNNGRLTMYRRRT